MSRSPSSTLSVQRRHPARGFILSLSALIAVLLLLPHAEPLFATLYPQLDRPLYQQDSFWALVGAHLTVVAASSAIAIGLGVLIGTAVTRTWGQSFRSLVETLLALSQSFPPVAVLAVTAPLIGFGDKPALIALALYAVLPVTQGTMTGIRQVPREVMEVGRGVGMNRWQLFWRIEWPLAFPVMLAGIRTAVVVNIGTAAIASTVGAKTLGLPIIVGLSGFNTAYVIQGALLVALLALTLDQAFEWLARAKGHHLPEALSV